MLKHKLLYMNMKNTVILLILLLSILGLIMGVYYTEDVGSDSTPQNSWERIYDDADGIMTITLKGNEKNESFLDNFFT